MFWPDLYADQLAYDKSHKLASLSCRFTLEYYVKDILHI